MSIHETRDDRLAAHVDRLRSGRRLYAARRPDRGDAVVPDVAALDDFIALHRHDPRAPQQRCALWDVALRLDENLRLHRLIAAGICRRSLRALLRGVALGRRVAAGAARRVDRVVDLTRAVDVIHEVRVADRVVHLVAVGAPRRELATNISDLA